MSDLKSGTYLSFDRKQKYLKWTREVVAELRGVNMGLEAQFDEAARRLDQILASSTASD
jgi:hypothetical protein